MTLRGVSTWRFAANWHMNSTLIDSLLARRRAVSRGRASAVFAD